MEGGIPPGSLLVAAGLRDPNFVDTVVIVMPAGDSEYTPGLVLNRPLAESDERWEREDLRAILGGTPARAGLVFDGGPVDSPPVVLHRLDAMGTLVVDDLYAGPDPKALSRALQQNTGDIRIYLGYVCWGPGQLQGEMSKGAWRLAPSNSEVPFMDPGEILGRFRRA